MRNPITMELFRNSYYSGRRHHRRTQPCSIAYAIGDFVFLVAAGVVATLVMHSVHELEWPFLVCMSVGMIGGMAAQMLMAWCVAPLLGSIESMVPSMLVGMISPMSICFLHLVGLEPMGMSSAAIGAVFGIGLFVFVRLYGRACRQRLSCSSWEKP